MKDYFRYLASSPRSRIWGCELAAIGHTRVPPKVDYPPARHPDDHHFQWARGRVLQSYQIVLVSEGGGVLESGRPGGGSEIQAGDVFLLFPGVWHRYAPARETGWTEHWIECRGEALERAEEAGFISAARPVVKVANPAEVLGLFLRMHELVRMPVSQARDGAATLAIHLVSRLGAEESGLRTTAPAVPERLERARQLILERCDRPLSVREIAKASGLGYSHFRQAFRRASGVGAREFHAEARLRRAADLVANTDLSAKEIAELLGFSSQFHFSNAFKARHGLAPSLWRERHRPGSVHPTKRKTR